MLKKATKRVRSNFSCKLAPSCATIFLTVRRSSSPGGRESAIQRRKGLQNSSESRTSARKKAITKKKQKSVVKQNRLFPRRPKKRPRRRKNNICDRIRSSQRKSTAPRRRIEPKTKSRRRSIVRLARETLRHPESKFSGRLQEGYRKTGVECVRVRRTSYRRNIRDQ